LQILNEVQVVIGFYKALTGKEMAKKKLNKKIAISGIIILAVLAVAAAAVFQRWQAGRDPDKLLSLANKRLSEIETQLTQYRQMLTDPDRQQETEELLEAGRQAYAYVFGKYGRAVAYAKDDARKIEILFELADLYRNTNNEFYTPNWEKIVRVWYSVTRFDPVNVTARMELLRYFYDSANVGNSAVWSMVKEQAAGTESDGSDGLIQIMMQQNKPPDLFVLKAKARASLELAASGQATDLAASLDEAIGDFETLLEQTPDDVDIYKHLARAIVLRGDIRSAAGYSNAAEEAARQAEDVLRKAVEVLPDNVHAHINLLEMRMDAIQSDIEKVRALEPDFQALAGKFDSSAAAWASLSRYYQFSNQAAWASLWRHYQSGDQATWASLLGYYQFSNQIDKAVDAIERAMKLDNQNIQYALSAINLHYTKSSLSDDIQFQAALDIANAALTLPDAQNVSGPRKNINQINRLTLHTFLARIYVEQALQALQDNDDEKNRLLAAKIEQNVHELTQMYGSSTNIHAIMWAGILDLARGHNEKAIRQMYYAYEQLNVAQGDNAGLSYMLALAFRDHPETGSRLQFLRNAIIGIAPSKPQLLLEYAELLLRIKNWSNAVSVAQVYERATAPNQRSRSIQVAAYRGSGQFDEAADILGAMDPDDPQTKRLRLSLVHARAIRMTQLQTQNPLTSEQQEQLDQYRRQRAEMLDELIGTHPEEVRLSIVRAVCENYLTQNKPDRAKVLVEKYLAHNADNLNALIFQRSLLEPDPLNIPSDRFNEITLEVTSEISDPRQRAVSLGRHYRLLGRYAQAADEYKKALDVAPDDEQAINGLFDMALLGEQKDFELAEQMAQKVRQNNLDGCEGNFYLAMLSFARADYNQALERVQMCLKSKPVFARAYYLRSRINNAIGNFDEAIKDARTAAEMNPLDITIARQRVLVLHERNKRLNHDLSTEQQQETEQALRAAIALNTNDWNLQSLYAQYRSNRQPDEALARFQFLQEQAPNVTNHLLLANLAMKMSRNEPDDKKEAGLLEMAGSAYEKAFALEPDNKTVQHQYSEFLRLTGRQDEAETILAGKDDVLWQFYVRDSRYEKAARVLDKLHKQDPKDLTVLRGLASVARLTGDKDGIRTYCEQILDIENTVDNQLFQIEMYLDAGLMKEAELKLAAFTERNPQELRGRMLNARVAMFRGQLDKALVLVNRILEIDGENAAAWRLRGNINRRRRDYTQAVSDLQKSKEISPNAAISLELADAYRQTKKIAAAIGELRSAISDPGAPARLRTTLEELYKEARQKNALRTFYDECIAKYPDLELWYYRAAQFYFGEKNLRKAEELLKQAWAIAEKAEKIDESSTAIFGFYLDVLLIQGQYQNVLNFASKYIDTPGLGSIAYAQMGQSHAKMGNRDLAVQYYHKALEKYGNDDAPIISTVRNMTQTVGAAEVDKWVASKLQAAPDSVVANIVAFYLAQENEQYNKALRHIEKCMAAATPSESTYARYSMFKAETLVKAYVKTSDKNYLLQAIEQYQKMLDDQPNNLQMLNNLAYLLAENNEQLDKAEEYGARAHTGAPNNPNLMDTYAYTLCKNGKFTKAEELLQSAIQLYEVNNTAVPWDVYRHLGMAQEGLERNELAAASYQQAIEIGGDTITPKDKDRLTQAIERVSR